MTTDKKELRKLIRQRKRQFSDSQLQELSFAVTESLVAHPRIKEAKVVMAYCSLADEVYTRSLIDKLRAMGKIVVLPVVLDDTRMEVRIYNDANDLKEGAYGISEPAGRRYDEIENIEVAIVPGMAFDKDGHRLGRGKGYYDRFLSQIPYIYKIGVCFGFQLLDNVPSAEYDIIMDEVINTP